MTEYSEGELELSRYIMPNGDIPKSKEDLKAILAESVDKSDGLELFGVSIKDEKENRVLCYTGNGPKSLANANRIIDCWEQVAAHPAALLLAKAEAFEEAAQIVKGYPKRLLNLKALRCRDRAQGKG